MNSSTEQARWQRMSRLFDRLAELPPHARDAVLDAECAGDARMRDQLLRMLALDAMPHAVDAGMGGVLETEEKPLEDDAVWLQASVGERLGPWQLQELIGVGASGAVFRARREDDTGQQAAIKRLRQRWDGSGQAVRFLQERRILAALAHPNIPRLLDHGLDAEARPWFALQLVSGISITEWADRKLLSLPERIELFLRVCEAVQHAHTRFIVHRDLKPANILVDDEGHPMVLDFGVAKRLDMDDTSTRTGLIAGFTPGYAAPEQIVGAIVTAATDVYALGAVLYQLLVGRLPQEFEVGNLRRMAEAISDLAPMKMEQAMVADGDASRDARLSARASDMAKFRRFVRGDLARIVQTALAKEPERRYASVEAFAADLKRFLQGRPVSVSGDTWRYRMGKYVRRNRWAVSMAGLAALLLIGGVSGVLFQSREARMHAARAEQEAKRATLETKRARAEAERNETANEFLRSVFQLSAPTATDSDVTLRQALETATEMIEKDPAFTAPMQVQFLLVAANSYESFGDEGKAEQMARRALALQEAKMPGEKSERARALLALAWYRMNFEPEQALMWANEGFQLQKENPLVSARTMAEAYSLLAGVQYGADKIAESLQTTREGRAFMLANGEAPTGDNVVASWSSEAVMLADLKRYDEAIIAHRKVIELTETNKGLNSPEALSEHLYLGYTLNVAERFEESIAVLEPTQKALEEALGETHSLTQLANMQAGRALLGGKRAADGAKLLGKAHEYGRSNAFEGRQGAVAAMYATALARSNQCTKAREVIAEMQQRKLNSPKSWENPLEKTSCA